MRIELRPQDVANRLRDLGGGQRRCRNLIEQRLEEVIIVPVDDGEIDGRPRQRFGRRKAAKSRSHNDDAWLGGLCSCRHDQKGSRRAVI
jgi:hypothetical protein